MNRRGVKGLDVRWLACGFALAGIVGVQVADPMNSLLPRAEAVPLAVTQSVGDLPIAGQLDGAASGPKIELVSAIAGRSLFMETRGIVKAQSTTTAETGDGEPSRDVPPIELIGTLLSQRADVALITEGADRPRRLQVGDTVSDWRIVRIQRDRLTLQQDDALAPVSLR